MKSIARLVPSAPDWRIDWDAIFLSPIGELLKAMDGVRQDPGWHGEGDVLVHTRMVCEALAGDPAFRRMDERDRAELFLASLIHDVGKVTKTREVGGTWFSPGHSTAGSHMARKFLWQSLDMAGTDGKRLFRETVCSLILFHSVPMHFISRADPERLVQSIAAEGCVVADFTLAKLAALVRADILGRKADDRNRLLDELSLFVATAQEHACLNGPPAFADAFSRFSWLGGKTNYPSQRLYNDTWGRVYMMCGLPGAGKDTWIRRNLPGVPVVSLDAIRTEIGVSWKDAQGPVVALAYERAREHLRAKRPFVWNATSLTPDLRRHALKLFQDYGAYTVIAPLETSWEEGLRRNRSRAAVVPESVVDSMLGRFTPPSVREAHEIVPVASPTCQIPKH